MNIGGESNSRARPLPAGSPMRAEQPVVTFELATMMLPLVVRIVADLRQAWVLWRAAVTRYDTVMAALDADADSPLAREAHRDVERRAADVEALRRELEPLGAACRSPRSGRVEWRTMVDASPTLLLWEPGEEAVTRFERINAAALVPGAADETDPSRS